MPMSEEDYRARTRLARALDYRLQADCCTDPACIEKRWNRAAIAALETPIAAAGALRELQAASQECWPITGSRACDIPGCTFEQDMQALLMESLWRCNESYLALGRVLKMANVNHEAERLRFEQALYGPKAR